MAGTHVAHLADQGPARRLQPAGADGLISRLCGPNVAVGVVVIAPGQRGPE